MKQNNALAFEAYRGRNVLFITTKNIDYLRNTQEIEALRAVAASVAVLGFAGKSYPVRLLKVYLRLLFSSLRRYDAVFVGFAPQLILPLFHWRLRRKFVGEDFFISLYDTMVDDRKKAKEGSFAAKLMLRIDEKTLQKADLIVADTRAHADYFIKSLGADAKKLHVVYLEADKTIYYPRETVKAVPDEPFHVLYFGSVLPLQGTEVILACVRLMKENHSVAFDFIGPVSEAEKKKCAGCNVRFTPWLSQDKLAERIGAADLCLAGHFNASIGKALRTIPGKAYIYEAMGKPMILGDNPANHELFEPDDTHFFVEMGDAGKLKDAILSVLKRVGNRAE